MAGPNGIDPMSVYSARSEINHLQWSTAVPNWIAIAFLNKMQLLKVCGAVTVFNFVCVIMFGIGILSCFSRFEIES